MDMYVGIPEAKFQLAPAMEYGMLLFASKNSVFTVKSNTAKDLSLFRVKHILEFLQRGKLLTRLIVVMNCKMK